ncbi:MAG: RidA family protein [Burkholderiales bacterium]|jgi:enamine deaminase RidA (YjgF/YER057c/UK114 family)|nr:RidA family protein [Burkholderiales bacterium]
MTHKTLQPEGWLAPRGYANGIEASGRQIYVGGQIGWNGQCQFETDDLVAQIRQALSNCVAVVAAGGGLPEHIVRMTWYLRDKKEYVARLKEIGAVYREVMGRHYPAMSAVQVADLIEDEAKVEIEVTAVVPSSLP